MEPKQLQQIAHNDVVHTDGGDIVHTDGGDIVHTDGGEYEYAQHYINIRCTCGEGRGGASEHTTHRLSVTRSLWK